MPEPAITSVPEQIQGTVEVKKGKTPAQSSEEAAEAAHKAILRDLEIQAKTLELKERKANLEDIEERMSERQLKRDSVRQKAYNNGATIRDIAVREAQVQKRCNHRKGGDGAAGIILGQGVSPHYAVIKHKMLTGDMWVRCQRCGKTWKPPIKKDYLPGGLLEIEGAEGYIKALSEYEAAHNFPTNNTPSSSQQFQWSDNGAFARETLRATTLR